MADLVQSKFELVHLPGGEQVKHGDVTLEGVEEVEKVMRNGVPYLVIKAGLAAETYGVGKFVFAHGEVDSVVHGGITLEGVESITKEVDKDGKPVVIIEVVLASEDYTAILANKAEAKKPEPKAVPAPKVASKEAE